jgi:molybdenum cofactor cytidylyltransferase
MEAHRKTLAPVVAPLIDGDRGNPVIFDRRTFSDFNELKGDVGGRAIYSRFRVNWIPWHDSRMRMDIDTESDYLQLKEAMGIESS